MCKILSTLKFVERATLFIKKFLKFLICFILFICLFIFKRGFLYYLILLSSKFLIKRVVTNYYNFFLFIRLCFFDMIQFHIFLNYYFHYDNNPEDNQLLN